MTSKFALTALALLAGVSAQAQSLDEIPKIECPAGQELYGFGLASSKQTLESIGEPNGGFFGPKVESADGNQNVHLEVCVDTANETAKLRRVQFRGGDFIKRGMFHGGNPMVRVVTIDDKTSGVVPDPAFKSLTDSEIHGMLAPSKAIEMRGSLRDLLFDAADSFEMKIPLGDVGVPDFMPGPGGPNRQRNTTEVLHLTQKLIAGEKIIVLRPEMKTGKLSTDSRILTGKLELGNPFAFCEGTSRVIENEVTLGTTVIRMKGCKESSFGGNGAAWSEGYKLVSIKDENPALAQRIDVTLDEASLKGAFQYKSDQHHHYCDMFAIKLKNLELFWEPNGYGYSCNDMRGEKVEELSLLGALQIPTDVPGDQRVFGVRYNGGAWKFDAMPESTVNPFPNAPPAGGGGMIIRPNNR